jgi:UDP-glucose:(heptosyl)LPS alpha-1,3-glucosyltransferase
LEKSALQSPVILTLTARQERDYQFYYDLKQKNFTRMPTGIDRKYQNIAPGEKLRKELRSKFNIADDQILIVQAAASFRTKGVDRTLYIISQLPEAMQKRITFIVAGDDRRRHKYAKLAEMLKFDARFPGGMDNLEELYHAADLLIHPARNEATGTVLVEALCCNLPVLTTDLCGYSEYISAAAGGVVLPEPFRVEHWILALQKLLNEPEHLLKCRQNIVNMYKNDFWYSRPAVMADEVIKFARSKGAK